MKKHISQGPERARKTNSLINGIQETLGKYGYSEIFLPLYEYYEMLKNTTWDFKDENIIRFIDRNSGKSLVLRPDFTPQVCRIVSTYMKDYPLPLRLQYKGRVFRNVNLDKGLKSEKYQIGFENFGSSELYGDIEMLNIADATMNKLGINEYKIVISDQGFLRILKSKLPESENYFSLLAQKNFDKISDIITNLDIDSRLKKLLDFLPHAFGGTDVLFKIKEYSGFDSKLSKRLEYLKTVLGMLEKTSIRKSDIIFDLGETRGLEYYTGINVNIINSNSGTILGSGGRYDSLMEKFGYHMTACGLAYNVEEVMPLYNYDNEGEAYDYLAAGEDYFFKAEELRKEGYRVFWTENPEDISELKKNYRFKNIIGEVKT